MKRIFTIVLLFLSAMLTAQEKQPYKLYNAKGKKSDFGKMIKALRSADIVLFGEYHNNAIAHWLQLEVTRTLGESRELVLGAEMFEQDNQEALDKDQLLYLQRKRKTGNTEYHVVASGESLYDICQKEAIRLDMLLDYNHLQRSAQLAVGEKLYLQGTSPSRPKL